MTVSSREITEWRAFYQLEPWGREAEDAPLALNTAVIANANRGADTPPFKLEDFLIQYGPEQSRRATSPLPGQKKQSVDEMKSLLKAMHRATKSKKWKKKR